MYKLRLQRLVVDDIYVYMSRKLGKRSTAKLLINWRGFFLKKKELSCCVFRGNSIGGKTRPSFSKKKNIVDNPGRINSWL
jgi:hypothetical protein